MTETHRILSNMIGLYTLIVAAWGIFNFLRRHPPDGNFYGAVVVAQVLFVVEGLVGILLLVGGATPARDLHWLYGAAIVLTLPGIYLFTRGSNTARESLLYGLGMLFVWGLSERAVYTGG